MRLRRRSNHFATLPASGPTPNPPKHRNLPAAFLARMHPRRAFDPRALEAACRDGLSTRKMAAMFRCHCSHVVRELRRHNLCTVAAALRASPVTPQIARPQAPASSPAPVAARQLCFDNNDLHATASLQNRRRGVQHAHPSGVEAGCSGDAMTLLSFEELNCAAMRIPRHLRRDIATLSRRPKLSLHRRGPALRRVAKWFCATRDRIAAEKAIKKYKTALRANQHGGVPYRLARRVQDEMYRGRIGRGVAWS